MADAMSEPMRVAFVSLGCVKNLVDSEKMLGQLAEAGCVITSDESDADAIVINTCGFLEAARTEADEVIREAVERKTDGQLKRVVVVGCLAQRDKEKILDRLGGIDARTAIAHHHNIRLFVHDMAVDTVDIHKGSIWCCGPDNVHNFGTGVIQRF